MLKRILNRLVKPKPEFKMKPYTSVKPPAIKQEALPAPAEDVTADSLELRESFSNTFLNNLTDYSYSLVARITEDTLVLKLSCSGLDKSYDFPIAKSEFDKYYNSDYLFFLASRIVKSLASIYPVIDEALLIDSFMELEEDEFLNVSYQVSYRLDLYFQYFSSNLLAQRVNEVAEDRWKNIKSQMHLLNNC